MSVDLALAERTNEILAAVEGHPGGVRAGELAVVFGKDVYQYLKRLTETGHIVKLYRGIYAPVR